MYHYIYSFNLIINKVMTGTVQFGRTSLIHSENIIAVQRRLLKHFFLQYEHEGEIILECFKVNLVDKAAYQSQSGGLIIITKAPDKIE